jgi:GNAT superfamily N-acetyltransferase
MLAVSAGRGDRVVIRHEPSISPDDVAVIQGRLLDAVPADVERREAVKVAFTARDDSGVLIGGVLGVMAWRWLHVITLAVDRSARGAGIGHRLLAEVEAHAVAHGCTHARLETFDFQARTFYERVGYQVYSALNGFPAGHTQFHMTKQLPAAPGLTSAP